MKILLIQPNNFQQNSIFNKLNVKLFPNPQITLQQIATITHEKHTIEILNEAHQKINFDEKYDLIGITCCTPSAPRAYEIADEYRKRGISVVLGGYHPSALPHEAKKHADSVVIGEAEISWPILLQDLEKNQIKPFYQSKNPANLDNLPQLKRNIGDYVFSMARIEATRGCPYKCEFCSISNSEIGWHFFRKKPIHRVIDEIKTIPQKTLIFCDTSLTIDIEYTKSLFTELKRLNKKFICYGNAHTLNKDEELLQLAHEAGCILWNIGFDSISQKALNSAGKNIYETKDFSSIVKKINGSGVAVMGQFILGFDTDTIEIFDKTIDTINEIGINVPAFNILTPFPGTPLYDRLAKEGRILTSDWSKYTLETVVFQPKLMSPEELQNGFNRLVKTFYHPTRIIQRVLNSINLGFYPFMEVFFENINERIAYKAYSKIKYEI